MPIYEFRCADCGTRFEALCRIGSSGEDLNCPQCQGISLQRLMSTFFSRGSSNGDHERTGASSSKCAGCSSHACATCR